MSCRLGLVACLAAFLAFALSSNADDAVRLEVDTSEADAVLAILGRRAAGEGIADSDWQRLFEGEPYRRLKQRELEMKRPFEEAEFREFVLSDALLKRRQELEQTLASWKRIDLEASARSVLGYLPEQARIRAKVFPVIKPKTNSFVFDLKGDPTIFLYVDPAVTAEQFANTVRHELHHIGLGSVASERLLEDLPPRAKAAAEWMGAFGEGMAMLAAAGGPDVHPHAHSSPADKARWDSDVANVAQDLRAVERFFLDIIDGRLKEDQLREKGFSFFGVQGPWYTVGWKMAALVERTYGRPTLIECMLDPRRLLAAYNSAVKTSKDGRDLSLWSTRLLRAVRAEPARVSGCAPQELVTRVAGIMGLSCQSPAYSADILGGDARWANPIESASCPRSRSECIGSPARVLRRQLPRNRKLCTGAGDQGHGLECRWRRTGGERVHSGIGRQPWPDHMRG